MMNGKKISKTKLNQIIPMTTPNTSLITVPKKETIHYTVLDLALYVDNDATLYSWLKHTKLSKKDFIYQNKEDILDYLNGDMD